MNAAARTQRLRVTGTRDSDTTHQKQEEEEKKNEPTYFDCKTIPTRLQNLVTLQKFSKLLRIAYRRIKSYEFMKNFQHFI